MQIQHVLDQHNRVSVPANGADPEPLGAFSVINFQVLRDLIGLICPSADDHHERADKTDPVLVPAERGVLLIFVRRQDPVPPAVTVSSEPPAVVERALVARSASEDYHHPVCAAGVAKRSRVIDPDTRLVVFGLKFAPLIRSLF